MLVALVKLLALGLGLSIVGVVLWLVFALLRIVWVSAIQWRDLFSIDRWTEVLVTIGRSKLRTALTMISVSWGIFVLVALLGLGNGLDNGMKKNFARDATNGVWISANKTSQAYGGYDVGRKLMFENADYERARKVDGIEYIAGQHFIRGQRWGSSLVTKRGAKANSFSLDAVHPEAIRLQSHSIAAGRFITTGDIQQTRKAAVIGQTVSHFLFEGANPIGEWIEIGSVPFQVVGVFSDPGGAEEERRIYIPISTAQLAFNGGEKVGMLQFTVGDASPEETERIIEQVKGQLADRYNFDPNDRQAVRVQNNIEQFERFRKLFWMISAFIVVIGLGTLAAGVVGVSNIMMIAVKERTKEIGVRKALGATPNSIIFMIIQEAVFLTGVAGLFGLAAGVACTELIGYLELTDFIHNPAIDIKVGIGATLFLVVAGALAGYFPARAAAKVNPIHALRDQ
ncbi:MAG: ABC transporter permease [Deltaproteobacteria bacterium]|nr:ABC transporter permease [Deltaproteobacteria bacterium]